MRQNTLAKQKLNSSLYSCEKDAELIIKKLFVESQPYSNELKKLLVVNTKDCLDDSNENYRKIIENTSVKDIMEGNYISLVPKIQMKEHEEVKSYIILTFDNFTETSNPEYRDCIVSFDIICHTDYWTLDNFQLRPLKIAGYIDGILNNTKLSGIGRFHFMGCNQLILNEDLSGYTLMYRAVHDVDGDDKIPPMES
jgi:hypothetical protein